MCCCCCRVYKQKVCVRTVVEGGRIISYCVFSPGKVTKYIFYQVNNNVYQSTNYENHVTCYNCRVNDVIVDVVKETTSSEDFAWKTLFYYYQGDRSLPLQLMVCLIVRWYEFLISKEEKNPGRFGCCC